MKDEIKFVPLDKYEVGLIVNVLNDTRNYKKSIGEDTTFLDEVLIKIIDTPYKKKHVKVFEGR